MPRTPTGGDMQRSLTTPETALAAESRYEKCHWQVDRFAPKSTATACACLQRGSCVCICIAVRHRGGEASVFAACRPRCPRPLCVIMANTLHVDPLLSGVSALCASGRHNEGNEVETALRDEDFAADLLESSDRAVAALVRLWSEVSAHGRLHELRAIPGKKLTSAM